MKRSKVLESNKTVIVLNWAKAYNWEGKDIKESINKTLNYYREMENIEPDITINQVKERLKQYLYKCITNDSYLRQELNEERKMYINPSAKNIQEFFKVNELPYKNTFEYANFLLLAYNEL